MGQYLTYARVVLDASLAASACVLAYLIRFHAHVMIIGRSPLGPRGNYAKYSTAWICFVLVAITLQQLYQEDRLFSGSGEIPRLMRAIVEASAVFGVLAFVLRQTSVSRGWFILTVALSFILVGSCRLTLRWTLRRMRTRGWLRTPVVVASDQPDLSWFSPTRDFRVCERLGGQELLDHLSGEVADDAESDSRSASRPSIVLKGSEYSEEFLFRVMVLAGAVGRSVYVYSPVPAVGRQRLGTRGMGGFTVVHITPPSLKGAQKVVKRSFDLVFAALGLLVALPLLILIGVSILAADGRPVFFRQQRISKDGTIFWMLKFRSMHPGAEAAGWTRSGDPRRTRFGALLRRYSLDELPQLLNVLWGQMSVVGPRPEQPHFAAAFSEELPRYRYRHRIRAGMTGWAQANGLRGDSSLDQRVDFDNWYIENWSLALDLKIVCRTMAQVIRGTGS